MISVVIPVYKNEGNIPDLLAALEDLARTIGASFEAVFVVDGSPDGSHAELVRRLPEATFASQVLALSRNFGSFAAIRAGMEVARGSRIAVMAADLQEPPSLIVEFDRLLRSGQHDIVLGQRTGRSDPFFSRLTANLFWNFYRRYIEPAVPPGGVDIFACTDKVRDRLLQMREVRSSLIGQLFWIGFRRVFVPYERQERQIGKSAWTMKKKVQYLFDSVFSFSDLPIRLLTRVGLLGLLGSVGLAGLVVLLKMLGDIPVPGYSATVLIVTFFGALNCLGLGVVGNYVFRTFENSKGRPNYIVAIHESFGGPLSLDAGLTSQPPGGQAGEGDIHPRG